MLAFIIALGLIGILADAQGVPPQVPAHLLQAAQRPPVDFGMALLSASIPCGLEIRARELQAQCW
jgi:hypothetical protein